VERLGDVMGTIKCNETKVATYTTEEVEYSYEQIRDIFDDDKSTICIQLLDRVEELETRLKLDSVADNEKLAEEVVELRAENQRLKAFIKKVVATIRDGDTELNGIRFSDEES
jgi:hypothetical protein